MNREAEEYLGDGVYVGFDGWHLILTTSNGISETNRIYLVPGVWERLVDYVGRANKR